MHPMLNIAVRAARNAGDIIVRHLNRLDQLTVSSKERNDFVSDADRQAEAEIIAVIRKAYPAHSVLAEESGSHAGDQEFQWIIDPLDGTTNFLHGIPQFAISIALERDGLIVAALTYNPANEEMFLAERGKGAYLNDQRIRVAARQKMSDAVVACGLPHYGRGDLALARQEIAAAQREYAGLRRYGAATLDLAWIAERLREDGLEVGEEALFRGQCLAAYEATHLALLKRYPTDSDRLVPYFTRVLELAGIRLVPV